MDGLTFTSANENPPIHGVLADTMQLYRYTLEEISARLSGMTAQYIGAPPAARRRRYAKHTVQAHKSSIAIAAISGRTSGQRTHIVRYGSVKRRYFLNREKHSPRLFLLADAKSLLEAVPRLENDVSKSGTRYEAGL